MLRAIAVFEAVKGLADVKGDGTYDTIYAKYFGAAPGAAAAATPATPASK